MPARHAARLILLNDCAATLRKTFSSSIAERDDVKTHGWKRVA